MDLPRRFFPSANSTGLTSDIKTAWLQNERKMSAQQISVPPSLIYPWWWVAGESWQVLAQSCPGSRFFPCKFLREKVLNSFAPANPRLLLVGGGILKPFPQHLLPPTLYPASSLLDLLSTTLWPWPMAAIGLFREEGVDRRGRRG